MTCTKENDFLSLDLLLGMVLHFSSKSFGFTLLAFSLLDFALRSPVSKSSKQQLVRVLGNQTLTYDSER